MGLKKYLAVSEYIDWQHPEILAVAARLASDSHNKEQIAKACFEFVRDEIKHSLDHQLNPVTCKASDVLHYGTGYCYAKSHLLAALLRANSIPAGLCYQRLRINAEPETFCLHGLNAVYLDDHGWYKIDPRGNKANINAEFCPPFERLAFAITYEGEANFTTIYAEPLSAVTDILDSALSYLDAAKNLPDARE